MQAAEEAKREMLVTLLADVARSYLELRAAQRELNVVDETIRSRRDALDLVRTRRRAGLGHDLDVARSEERLATANAERPILQRAATLAIHRVAVLVGEHPDALLDQLNAAAAFPSAPPAIPQTLPSELLSRRPDLRRAERELAAATALAGVARADLYPRFVILGNFGRLSADMDDLASGRAQFGGLIAGARWPVFSGGRIRANIRAHDARQEQAALAYEQAVLRALQDVADWLVIEARERERQDSLRTAVAASRLAYDLAFERGSITIQLRSGDVQLTAGELLIVPRGVEHRPVAAEEAEVMLFEAASTVNTGEIRNERTYIEESRPAAT